MVVAVGSGGVVTVISWVEAKAVVKLPTMPRTAPTTRNYPAVTVSSAKVEKSLAKGKAFEAEGTAHTKALKRLAFNVFEGQAGNQ